MRTIHTPATTRGRQEARLGSAKACDMRGGCFMPTGGMHTFNMVEKRGWWWALGKRTSKEACLNHSNVWRR